MNEPPDWTSFGRINIRAVPIESLCIINEESAIDAGHYTFSLYHPSQ